MNCLDLSAWHMAGALMYMLYSISHICMNIKLLFILYLKIALFRYKLHITNSNSAVLVYNSMMFCKFKDLYNHHHNFVYLFTSWCTLLELFLLYNYYEKCCYEHSHTSLCMDTHFHFSRVDNIFVFLR